MLLKYSSIFNGTAGAAGAGAWAHGIATCTFARDLLPAAVTLRGATTAIAVGAAIATAAFAYCARSLVLAERGALFFVAISSPWSSFGVVGTLQWYCVRLHWHSVSFVAPPCLRSHCHTTFTRRSMQSWGVLPCVVDVAVARLERGTHTVMLSCWLTIYRVVSRASAPPVSSVSAVRCHVATCFTQYVAAHACFD